MAVKDNKVRKLVTLDKEDWAEIDEIRFASRFKTESDAMRHLLRLGVTAHKAGEKLRKKR